MTTKLNIFLLTEIEGYQKTKKFMKELMPKKCKIRQKYRGKIILFHDASIEES